MTYRVGDIVRIKVVKEPNGWLKLVSNSDRFPPNESDCFYKKVQVVGVYQMNSNDYIVLCDFDPHSYLSFKIEAWHQKGYDVPDKHLGMRGCYIGTDNVWPIQASAPTQQVVLHSPGGMACKLCKKFIQYAGVNRDDGTFVCKKCRETKSWMLKCKALK